MTSRRPDPRSAQMGQPSDAVKDVAGSPRPNVQPGSRFASTTDTAGPFDAAARDLWFHGVQTDVERFHSALDIPIGDSPAIRRPELRAELIREEAQETVEAILAGDLVAACDGLCDLLCVVYGAAVEFGVNLAPLWDEVHATNMAKVGGPVREDGKRLKPEGWKPPQLAPLIERQARHAA